MYQRIARVKLMKGHRKLSVKIILCIFVVSLLGGVGALAAQKSADKTKAFPQSLESYNDSEIKSIAAVLKNRIKQEPFNLVASIICQGGA
jgi:hypothetical protein